MVHYEQRGPFSESRGNVGLGVRCWYQAESFIQKWYRMYFDYFDQMLRYCDFPSFISQPILFKDWTSVFSSLFTHASRWCWVSLSRSYREEQPRIGTRAAGLQQQYLRMSSPSVPFSVCSNDRVLCLFYFFDGSLGFRRGFGKAVENGLREGFDHCHRNKFSGQVSTHACEILVQVTRYFAKPDLPRGWRGIVNEDAT